MTLDENLVKEWETLKEHGAGYISSFQMGSKFLGKNFFSPLFDHIDLKDRIQYDFRTLYDHAVYVELIKHHEGVGYLFSLGYLTHRDESYRLGYHDLHVMGDHTILKRTLTALEKDPKSISRFVNVIFDWRNMAYKDYKSRRIKSEEIQPDFTSDMKWLCLLDAGDGYGLLKRWGIKIKGKNPDVKVVEVK